MMNARDWVTLVMRLTGIVLAALSVFPLMGKLMTKFILLFASDQFVPSLLSFRNWTSEIKLASQLILGLYLLLGGKWVIKLLFRGLGGKEGYCPHCDYDVRGITSNRCPECGKLIHPNTD